MGVLGGSADSERHSSGYLGNSLGYVERSWGYLEVSGVSLNLYWGELRSMKEVLNTFLSQFVAHRQLKNSAPVEAKRSFLIFGPFETILELS